MKSDQECSINTLCLTVRSYVYLQNIGIAEKNEIIRLWLTMCNDKRVPRKVLKDIREAFLEEGIRLRKVPMLCELALKRIRIDQAFSFER